MAFVSEVPSPPYLSVALSIAGEFVGTKARGLQSVLKLFFKDLWIDWFFVLFCLEIGCLYVTLADLELAI